MTSDMNYSLSFGAVLSSFLSLAVGCTEPPSEQPSGGGGFGGDFPSGVVSSNVTTGLGPGSGGGEPLTLFTSGTRLRAHILDAGGEAQAFEGWFDSELGFDCTSTEVAGESNRCMPPPLEEVVYLDAACAMPAADSAQFGATEAPPFTVERTSGEQNCDAYRAYAVGEEQIVASIFVKDPSGGCTEIVEERAVHALAPASLDVFAELAIEDEGGALVFARTERGPDGAFRIVSGLIKSIGEPCVGVGSPFDAGRFCAPSRRIRDPRTFAEGSCAEPAIALDACQITQLHAITDVTRDVCGRELATVYQPGAIVDDVFLADENSTCNATPSGRGRLLGAPMDTGVLPYLDQLYLHGSSIDLAVDVGFGKAISSAGTFTTPGGYRCFVVETHDGLRCLPPLLPRPTTFSDAACTVPLTVAPPSDCYPPPAVGTYASDGLVSSVSQVGSAYAGPVYEGGDGTPCTLVAESEAGWSTVVNEASVTTFPELVRRVE